MDKALIVFFPGPRARSHNDDDMHFPWPVGADDRYAFDVPGGARAGDEAHVIREGRLGYLGLANQKGI